MKDHHKALFIAAALIGFGVCSAQAAHKDVKHCADDYRKFYDAGITISAYDPKRTLACVTWETGVRPRRRSTHGTA